jgi:hypothetical protein
MTEETTKEASPIIPGTEIYQAIQRVYAKVGYVLKSGEVKSNAQNYKYAGEADFIEALRPAMIEENLICMPVNIVGECRNIMAADKPKNHACYIYTFRLIHSPSGQYVEVAAAGEGIGNDDKSSYKAATGAQKYALRQLFLIETGNDPDKDPVTAREEEEKKKQQEAAAAAEKAANEKKDAIYKKFVEAAFIVIPDLDEEGKRDWGEWVLKIIDMIKKSKNHTHVNAVYEANAEGLAFLKVQDEKYREQISKCAKEKRASFKAPPSPPIE